MLVHPERSDAVESFCTQRELREVRLEKECLRDKFRGQLAFRDPNGFLGEVDTDKSSCRLGEGRCHASRAAAALQYKMVRVRGEVAEGERKLSAGEESQPQHPVIIGNLGIPRRHLSPFLGDLSVIFCRGCRIFSFTKRGGQEAGYAATDRVGDTGSRTDQETFLREAIPASQWFTGIGADKQ
jgi:hypothetical protein